MSGSQACFRSQENSHLMGFLPSKSSTRARVQLIRVTNGPEPPTEPR